MLDWRMFTRTVSLIALVGAALSSDGVALAVQMKEDPRGFEGIPWGATLSESETFGKVEEAGQADGAHIHQ